MPEYTYISHKVKKGETLWGIARQYNVEEHKIIQSNPEIKIAPKGKGKYEIANLKEGQILRIPQEKKTEKKGVKTLTGNISPKAGIKEKYRVMGWYPGTPTEMKNPAHVKWALYYKEKGKYTLKLKKETGEFTFHEQAVGKDIKIVGYLYSPELDNDSALSVKVSSNQTPSITSLTLYDVKKDKPLPRNAKLKLGQGFYVVANTTNSVGKRIEFTLLKKEEKEEESEYTIIVKTTEKISSKGTATTAFLLNDFKLLISPQKKHYYKVNVRLEGAETTYVFDNGVEVEKDSPKQQPKKEDKKKEESLIYKGTTVLKEGWNKLKEEYKKMTTSEEPQIQKVSLYIPENKTKVSYGEILKLKIEGKYLKGQSIEYTVYEFDNKAVMDELDSGIIQMKGDIQELDIQLTQEMYKKGGTDWFELMDGKHEIFVSVKLKGKDLVKTTGIIEVDTSTMETEKLPGNRPVMTGELDKKGEKEEEKCPNCEADITIVQLKKIYTQASDTHLKELAETLNKYKKVFKLDTCARKAHFFAQSIEESGLNLNGALHGESLDYPAERLPIQFKKFRKRNAQGKAIDKFGNPTTENKKTVPNDLAYEYGRSSRNGYKANQKKIAEIAYGDRGGNLTPEDAWNFRGRGLLQITFRNTYGEIQKRIDKLASDLGVKISDGKDRDYTPKEAALTGMADWYKDDMFLKADLTGKFADNEVVDLIVDIINKDTDSREKRKKHYKTTKVVFDITSCPEIKTQEKKEKKKKYDIEKAVAHVNSNALSKSKGVCALYVRKAINAGGIYNLSGHAREYYDTDKLVTAGFTKLGNDIDSIQLKKGDIAAFAAVKGHPYGHIAMYNGVQWVSDFKQKSFWVATQYSVEKKYTIYRWNE